MWHEKESINPLCFNDLEFINNSPYDRDINGQLAPVDSAYVPPLTKMMKLSSDKVHTNTLFYNLMSLESQPVSTYKRPAVELVGSCHSTASFVYKTRAPRRGTCLIISVDSFNSVLCLPDRPGADVDLNGLENTFYYLDFDVKIHRNPTAAEILSIIETESAASHADADCFACVILTHGDDGGSLYGTDGPIPLAQLIHPFRGDTCPSLAGKPKMFFIQACRGTLLDSGTLVSTDSSCEPGESGTLNGLRRIPVEADLLVAYAVQPGYYAFRNSVHGSWFIQALNKCLCKYGRVLDLMSIMTRVNCEVAFEFESFASTAQYSGKKQVPSIVSTLTKDVFFPPKSPTITSPTSASTSSTLLP